MIIIYYYYIKIILSVMYAWKIVSKNTFILEKLFYWLEFYSKCFFVEKSIIPARIQVQDFYPAIMNVFFYSY
jgi:hypothetical protein